MWGMGFISQHSSVTQVFCGPLKPPTLTLEPEHFTLGAKCQIATSLEAFVYLHFYHCVIIQFHPDTQSCVWRKRPRSLLSILFLQPSSPSAGPPGCSILQQSQPTSCSPSPPCHARRDVQANTVSLQSEDIWVPNMCIHQAIFGWVWNAAGSSQLWLLAGFISLHPSPPFKIHLILEGLVSGVHCCVVHSGENCSKHPLPTLDYTNILWSFRFSSYSGY